MYRKPNSECQIMIFRPTMEEFSDFSRYVQYMESQGAHRGGVAKIIPPKEWKPCKTYDNIDNLVIPAPISQVVTGQKGLFTLYNIQQKPLTVKEMRRLTNTDRYASPFHENYEDLERNYWKNLTFNPAIYGADISGSLYDKDVDVWNVSCLDTILDLVENDTGVKIEGVNTAYLYFGMWKASFAWHTEDMDLYSINYIHFGAPKTWYSVPPEHGKRLERLASGFFPNSNSTCPAFLRHKMTLISPSVLKKFGIPFNKITHEAGEFMITFPYGYHSGFNHGFNCAESTNFASERWIDYGIAAEKCRCRNDMVYINMDLFVKTFKPEKYECWKGNKHEPKLSYTDVPPVPDFTKPLIHWRTRMEEISKRSSLALALNPNTTPQKMTCTHTIAKQFLGSLRKDIKTPLNISKVPLVKIDKTPALAPMRFKEVFSKRTKKGQVKRRLSAVEETMQRCSPGTSGSLLSAPGKRSHQLKMGCVLPVDVLPDELKSQSLNQNRCRQSVMDEKKPGEGDCCSTPCAPGIHQLPPGTSSDLAIYHRSTPPPNSDHSLYAKPAAKTPTKPKSYAPLPVKFQILNSSASQLAQLRVMQPKTTHQHSEFKSTKYIPEKLQSNEQSTVATPQLESYSTSEADNFAPARLFSIHAPSGTAIAQGAAKYLQTVSSSPKVAKRPPLKRRHLVSKKGPSKKSSPAVLLKSTSGDTDSSSEEEKYSGGIKKMRGRPRSKQGPIVETEGYPSLWPRRKISLRAERQYNATVAKLPPYCAICTLFQPYYRKFFNSKENPLPFLDLLAKSEALAHDKRTKPLIPETIFATSVDDPAPLAACELLDAEGKSPLIQCNSCKVQVHASCYGIVKPENPWTCDRCSFKAWIVQCALCCMQGGALKPVNDGRQWAHIICAVAIPEVSFDDVPRRDGISIKKLSQVRQKLRCTYCRRHKSQDFYLDGTCIQCCAGSCATSFHPTCAHAAGVKMEPGDWPLPVFVYCHRHALQKEKALEQRTDKALPDVTLGQKVYGKHKNTRYYPCIIRGESTQNFHHVVFTDMSWSDNLYQQDIISHDFAVTAPKMGDAVLVRWTDGKSYEAEYVQCKRHQVLSVEFEDGSSLPVKREDIHTSMDDMPQKIRRKLSNATLMSSPDHLEPPKRVDPNAQSFVSQRAAFNASRKKKLAADETLCVAATQSTTTASANDKFVTSEPTGP